MPSKFINVGEDKKKRCWWCGADPLYVDYHDNEWGQPKKDNRRLFEKISLEGFQAGLSWITILRKRESFREVFDNFEIEKVAQFSKSKVNSLLKDARIIRHRGKIEATINNAQRALEMIEAHGSIAKFAWSFEPKPRKFDIKRTTTAEATKMSKDLKKLGWKFVGPTTCYSFMQALGIVNDHHPDCDSWKKCETLRKKFKR